MFCRLSFFSLSFLNQENASTLQITNYANKKKQKKKVEHRQARPAFEELVNWATITTNPKRKASEFSLQRDREREGLCFALLLTGKKKNPDSSNRLEQK